MKLAFFEDYTELDFDSKIQEIKKDYTKSLELKLAVALPTGLVEVHKELIQETEYYFILLNKAKPLLLN